MKVAVLGAAGWLGRAILKNFEPHHHVRACDAGPQAWDIWRDIDGDWQGETVHADIADFDAVARVMQDC
ncbi:MAG: NAD(P)-dependent oxidoreductase, partial [candidate division Zixibacteria bacterium]|nr:NAD(P)-dependent oxidoreductase [candidate division Zixibacteria bacterium]